jgi:glycine C-acetyltransferase
VRLCKAQRFRYANADLADLERSCAAADARFRLIVTDGVFSMDGVVAPLAGICDLAERHDALVMVDDSHAVGFMGRAGAAPTSTPASGARRPDHRHAGQGAGRRERRLHRRPAEIVELLRQRSRPYLFSNALAPSVVAASLRRARPARGLGDDLRARVHANAAYFRERHDGRGLHPGGRRPPDRAGDDRRRGAGEPRGRARMLEEGVYVVGFSFPVVPRGQARIRTQMSAAHTRAQLDRAVDAFVKVGRELGLIA